MYFMYGYSFQIGCSWSNWDINIWCLFWESFYRTYISTFDVPSGKVSSGTETSTCDYYSVMTLTLDISSHTEIFHLYHELTFDTDPKLFSLLFLSCILCPPLSWCLIGVFGIKLDFCSFKNNINTDLDSPTQRWRNFLGL